LIAARIFHETSHVAKKHHELGQFSALKAERISNSLILKGIQPIFSACQQDGASGIPFAFLY
jgi:hypothetical protein